MSISTVLYEALDPLNKIANSIIKKLNYIESSLILKSKSLEDSLSYLDKTASYHSNAYDELSKEQQTEVLNRIWNKIHNILGKSEQEINEEKADLEQIIYDYLKTNYWSMYPLEKTAKDLADRIKNN